MSTVQKISWKTWGIEGIRLLVTAGLACSLFSGTVAVLLVATLVQADFHEDGLTLRLLIKGGVFLAAALGCLFVLLRLPSPKFDQIDDASEKPSRTPNVLVAGGLLLVVLLLFPNLDGYPWAAPDELHHLVVAKNLAVHHAYASGHPDTEFEYFDPYDSVGVSVLGPIAIMFKVFGESIPVARCFTVASMFLLIWGVLRLLRFNGVGASGAAVTVLVIASFGSVYLSRSLYGEVPALMFLVWGLVFWHKALGVPKPSGWAVLTGVFFAMAVLAKMFMFIGAFALAAVFLSDLVRERRIRWHQVIIPAGVLISLVAAWWIVAGMYTNSGGSMAVYYRHYLMFGFDGFREGISWFTSQPLYVVVMLIALGGSIPVMSKLQWSPPLLVLLITAVLYAFWWVFFTPGTIPRYLWYTCVILGVFAALPFTAAVKRLASRPGTPRQLLLCIGVVGIIVVDAASRLYEQADLVYRHDQAGDERGMALYLEDLPADSRIATTYWPAELSMNFMADRVVTVVADYETGMQDYDVVIMNRDFTPIPDSLPDATTRIGRYVIVSQTLQEGIPD